MPKKPNKPTRPAGPKKPRPYRVALIAPILMAFACASAQKVEDAGKEAGARTYECAGETVKSRVPEVSPILLAILESPANWRAILTAVGEELGNELLACALTAISDAADQATPGRADSRSLVASPAANRAATYMAEQGWAVR